MSAAVGQVGVWQSTLNCGVTLAVKLPPRPGSPLFLQSLQTTKWSYLKNKIIKQAPFLLKSAGIFHFLQPRIFTDDTQLWHLLGNLWSQFLSLWIHSSLSNECECLKIEMEITSHHSFALKRASLKPCHDLIALPVWCDKKKIMSFNGLLHFDINPNS